MRFNAAASHLFFGVDLRLGGIVHLAVDSRLATSNRELVRDVVEPLPLPIVNAANVVNLGGDHGRAGDKSSFNVLVLDSPTELALHPGVP